MSEPKITVSGQTLTVTRSGRYLIENAPPITRGTAVYLPTELSLDWRNGEFIGGTIRAHRTDAGDPTGLYVTEPLPPRKSGLWPDWLTDFVERETVEVTGSLLFESEEDFEAYLRGVPYVGRADDSVDR